MRLRQKQQIEILEARVRLLASRDEDLFKQWLEKKGQLVRFQIAVCNIDLLVRLTQVILIIQNESAVEIELRFK